MVLEQKIIGDKRRFELVGDKVKINTSSFTESFEFTLELQSLGFDIVKKIKKKPILPIIGFIAMDILYIALLISAIIDHDNFSTKAFWVACLLFFLPITFYLMFHKPKSFIYVSGGPKQLELLHDNPSKMEVEAFIKEIHFRLKQIYKDQFGKVSRDLDKEYQKANFKWLFEIGAIDKEEYNELLTELDIQTLL